MTFYAPPVSLTEARGCASQVIGTFTASGQSVVIAICEFNGVVAAVSGTFSGVTVVLEASYDNQTTWIGIRGSNVASGVVSSSFASLSAAAAVETYVPGATHFRLRCSAYASGTVNVYLTPISAPADGTPDVTVAGGTVTLGASAALAGDIGVGVRATSTNALTSVARLVSAAASVNATVVKSSAGRVYRIRGYNAAAAVRYLKLYSKTTAPTVGTDTPVVTLALAPTSAFDVDFGAIGYYIGTGIGYGLTTAAADADTTALTAADVVGLNIWYA